MTNDKIFDVIIVGGSYAGLAAGMALGRALKKVLIMDNGQPCNRQTPYSHNFLTQDGKPPKEIAEIGKQQLAMYETISFFNGLADKAAKTEKGFEIQAASGEMFWCKKVIFATGIRDILPDVIGLSECWGISVLHCPYCHGYEVKNQQTVVLGNGESGFELTRLISNWTKDLTLFTNGSSALTQEQTEQLERHSIKVVEKEIERLEHTGGSLNSIIFRDGTKVLAKAMYARNPFEQHCRIPESLGCVLTTEGYIQTDIFQETSVPGVFTCGDNATRMRTVANAVATGTAAGIAVSNRITFEEF